MVKPQNTRKSKVGTVISNKMHKTVTVLVERTVPHSKYKKVISIGKKYYAHREESDLQVGQRVRITETRPLSKMKRWIVKEVLS